MEEIKPSGRHDQKSQSHWCTLVILESAHERPWWEEQLLHQLQTLRKNPVSDTTRFLPHHSVRPSGRGVPGRWALRWGPAQVGSRPGGVSPRWAPSSPAAGATGPQPQLSTVLFISETKRSVTWRPDASPTPPPPPCRAPSWLWRPPRRSGPSSQPEDTRTDQDSETDSSKLSRPVQPEELSRSSEQHHQSRKVELGSGSAALRRRVHPPGCPG